MNRNYFITVMLLPLCVACVNNVNKVPDAEDCHAQAESRLELYNKPDIYPLSEREKINSLNALYDECMRTRSEYQEQVDLKNAKNSLISENAPYDAVSASAYGVMPDEPKPVSVSEQPTVMPPPATASIPTQSPITSNTSVYVMMQPQQPSATAPVVMEKPVAPQAEPKPVTGEQTRATPTPSSASGPVSVTVTAPTTATITAPTPATAPATTKADLQPVAAAQQPHAAAYQPSPAPSLPTAPVTASSTPSMNVTMPPQQAPVSAPVVFRADTKPIAATQQPPVTPSPSPSSVHAPATASSNPSMHVTMQPQQNSAPANPTPAATTQHFSTTSPQSPTSVHVPATAPSNSSMRMTMQSRHTSAPARVAAKKSVISKAETKSVTKHKAKQKPESKSELQSSQPLKPIQTPWSQSPGSADNELESIITRTH